MIKPKKLSSSLVAATLCMASAGWTAALAQTATTTPNQTVVQQTTTTTTTTTAPQTISKCSQLIGTCVQNQQGDNLGKISDVVVDFNNNQVSYCVLNVKHGAFGRTKYVAVPLAAFQPSADGSYVVLNANRANLLQARGFNRNEWPSEIVPAWGAEPGPAVELPPAIVYAPAPVPVQPRAQSWAADPQSSTPLRWQSASYAINGMQDQVQFGEAQMSH
jgi:sporulation protein YlmC with PRC-barrel domain